MVSISHDHEGTTGTRTSQCCWEVECHNVHTALYLPHSKCCKNFSYDYHYYKSSNRHNGQQSVQHQSNPEGKPGSAFFFTRQPWAGYSASLRLSFPIYKVRVINVLISRVQLFCADLNINRYGWVGG